MSDVDMRVEVILGSEKCSNIMQVNIYTESLLSIVRTFNFVASGYPQHQAGGKPELRHRGRPRDEKLPAGFKNIRGTEILCGEVSWFNRSISSEIKHQTESLSLPCSTYISTSPALGSNII